MKYALPECVFQWRSSVRWSMNFLLHFWHWCGFDFECVSMWVFKALFPLKEFLQTEQVFRLTPVNKNHAFRQKIFFTKIHLDLDYQNSDTPEIP